VKVTQQEFDELDGIIVHLLTDDGDAFCSGERVDPKRWEHSTKLRKQCQACFWAARRTDRDAYEAKQAVKP